MRDSLSAVTRPIRRFVKVLAVSAMLLIVAAGCSSAGNPIDYTDQSDLNPQTGLSVVESNWLEGCEVGFGEELAESANSICACSYREISDPVTGIPFEDFVEVNERLENEPDSLLSRAENPDSTEALIVGIVANCIADS